MADRESNVEAVKNPRLGRDQLTPAAREPQPTSEGAGFGSFYPDPVEQREDAPVLGPAQVEETGEMRHPVLAQDQGPWPNEASRDFRQQEYDPDTVRPVNE
jgi:hypothetical protein